MTPDTDVAIKRGRGRPQIFDRDRALESAMKLFWDRGYEGTTFDDLIGAMKISPSTFYNSFGNKERLYRETTELYLNDAGNFFTPALAKAKDAKGAFEALIEAAAVAFTREEFPSGCMISLAGTHLPPSLNALRETMRTFRDGAEQALADRLSQGVADGDLPQDTDVAGLAAYFETVFRGMAVDARDGASTERLRKIGATAMRAWPSA
uniref:Transcriptional regulator, TetR family n=1 Tax=Caulobacter sp. (strain K31) TaxID=366602 RepID=B0T961_CAUSK